MERMSNIKGRTDDEDGNVELVNQIISEAALSGASATAG
jgi:hypothetical protein